MRPDSTASSRLEWGRAVALTGVLVALGASLQVLYHLVDVVGVPTRFLAVVAASLVAATALARYVPVRTAVLLGGFAFAGGMAWYLSQLSGDPMVGALLADVFDLLGGETVLRISNVRAWVLAVSPAPVFLTWYFAVRERYGPAVAVAGATLGFFVLTGDADLVTTVTGVVAATAALGLGDVHRRGEAVGRAEPVLVAVALMIAVPAVVSVLPGTALAAGAWDPGFGGGGTLEAGLVDADEDLAVGGPVTLSPAVRFTVTSEAGAYWRTGSYDRYTGSGWVRSGSPRPYDPGQRLPGPVGESRRLNQRVRVVNGSGVLPAAWRPVALRGVSDARVLPDGSFAPDATVPAGTTYRVESRVPDPSPQQLQTAGTDYPDRIEREYTQLPESTPDRVATRTARLTANAETPYETARVVERYLERSKNYSLSVSRPRGDVADAFLFEMNAGYCTYFATTMVTMLRTQDVPARFVAGYTTGERVDEDEWVVRGLDAHAWVEVYFPDQGWVRFDPTPTAPRTGAEQRALVRARDAGVAGVDTGESGPAGEAAPETATERESAATNGTNASAVNGTGAPSGQFVARRATRTGPSVLGQDSAGTERVPRAPTGQQVALGVVALVGAALGLRRSGIGRRAARAVWLRYQRRSDPETDVERAYRRLEYHLERRTRARRPGETARQFLDAVDAGAEARRVGAIRERSRYGGAVDADDADEAVRLVNDLVR